MKKRHQLPKVRRNDARTRTGRTVSSGMVLQKRGDSDCSILVYIWPWRSKVIPMITYGIIILCMKNPTTQNYAIQVSRRSNGVQLQRISNKRNRKGVYFPHKEGSYTTLIQSHIAILPVCAFCLRYDADNSPNSCILVLGNGS
jgi:hypothetical protein